MMCALSKKITTFALTLMVAQLAIPAVAMEMIQQQQERRNGSPTDSAQRGSPNPSIATDHSSGNIAITFRENLAHALRKPLSPRELIKLAAIAAAAGASISWMLDCSGSDTEGICGLIGSDYPGRIIAGTAVPMVLL